jgi:hypothetical protein
MDSELSVRGAIVDSWVEREGAPRRTPARLVLQVAPRDRPRDLLIVEAAPSLVPDPGWLQDLGENLCHGSPIAATGRLTGTGRLCATRLELQR